MIYAVEFDVKDDFENGKGEYSPMGRCNNEIDVV